MMGAEYEWEGQAGQETNNWHRRPGGEEERPVAQREGRAGEPTYLSLR